MCGDDGHQRRGSTQRHSEVAPGSQRKTPCVVVMRHVCRVVARLLLVLIAASPSPVTQDYKILIHKVVAQTKKPGARPGFLT
jgi:hypothetical protein